MAGASDYPPAFEGEFASWKQKMEVYLKSNFGIYLIMKSGYEAPKKVNGEELEKYLWKEKQRDEFMANARAEFHLLTTIPNEDLDKVGEYNSAKELWEKFLKIYEESESKVNAATTPIAEFHPEATESSSQMSTDEGEETSEESC